MSKRILAMLLALVMVLSIMPAAALATEATVSGEISSSLVNLTDPNETFFSAEIIGLNASESVVIKLYSGQTLVATTTLQKAEYYQTTPLSVKICTTGESSSWKTDWEAGHPRADYVPDKLVLYVDGQEMNTASVLMTSTNGEAAVNWATVPGVNVASVGDTYYTSLKAAIENANGATIKILADLEAPVVVRNLSASVNIDGNGATLSGGLWLEGAVESVKVSGVKFTTRGLAVLGATNVEIKDNTFSNITEKLGADFSDTYAALYKDAIRVEDNANVTISGNTIDTVGEVGIDCARITGCATITNNTVKNTAHNTIQVVDNSAKAVITGNTLENWATGGEGRALRAQVSELKFEENTMKHTSAPEEFVKVTNYEDASKISLENNNWNDQEPTDDIVTATGVTINDYVGKPEDTEIKVKHNLNLASEIDFSFFVDVEELDNTGLTATITHKHADGDKVVDAAWKTTTSGGVTYWRFRYEGVAAKEMIDELVLTITDADGNEVLTDTYSVKDYAMLCINDPLSQNEANLMKALLDYGAAAQEYFSYKTNNLANADLNG